ncbi:MAG: hypothetical protein ACMG5Z_07830 [Luteimonas sp.]
MRRSHDDHHRILEAIRLRDAPRAEILMREHIHSVKLRMRSRLLTDADNQVAPTATVVAGPRRAVPRPAKRS